jgi:hypothetical protein
MITFFTSAGTFLLLSLVALWSTYRLYLRKVKDDIAAGTKIIEKARITRKQYMPRNNTFFFYINSAIRICIEVNEEVYRNRKIGDEVCIEYTTHSKLYLGYF